MIEIVEAYTKTSVIINGKDHDKLVEETENDNEED